MLPESRVNVVDVVTSPLTKKGCVSFINSIEPNNLAKEWFENFGIDISNELAKCKKIDLYKCNETGLRFFIPESIAGSEHLYAKLQKFNWFYMPWKWEHDILYSRLDKRKRVLEVGCATGAFIEKLWQEGVKVVGIELNSAAVSAAQAKGLPVSASDLSDLARHKAETFDVVCSFQVLEHVSDPASFIKGCITLVKPKGRLVVCVPNNESFLQYQHNILDMPPHHMTQWSVAVFKALENIFPLRLIFVKYEPLAHYHVNGYLQAHQNRLIKLCRLYRLLLNRFTIPVLRFLMLRLGLRHLCRGQSIYVEFEKT